MNRTPLIAIINRYWQTLRHLKPVQIIGRVRYRFMRPKADRSPAPALRSGCAKLVSFAQRYPSLISADCFILLNKRASLADIGWDDPAVDKLWRYNQHYFDDLNSMDAGSRRKWHHDLLKRWVAENPIGSGTGWEPYPTSVRIVNWIKWALSGNHLSPECLQSLAEQSRWLMQRLEWHLLGNHLFANAKALVFAGLFYDGVEAQCWLVTGLGILSKELPEQVLADGAQFELSPMYHALALEDVLDLINIIRSRRKELADHQIAVLLQCEDRIELMRQWLETMCHPDGEISFFNDAAIGIAPSSSELDAYSMRLGFSSKPSLGQLHWLKESGYARLVKGNAVLIADLARLGPDYLPGHAHADTLSFEFSLGRQRIFVNSGTSVYGLAAERQRQRGTAAHNTVVVEHRNSSDVWSGFRVGRRARIVDSSTKLFAGVAHAQATHDGYSHLLKGLLHRRTWKLSDNSLLITDFISKSAKSAESRFHLHPDLYVELQATDAGVIILPNGNILNWKTDGRAVSLEKSSWHPQFGISLSNICIVVQFRDGNSRFEMTWI